MEKISRLEALNFHSKGEPEKIEVIPSKSHNSQYDLSLAYSPELRNRVRVLLVIKRMFTSTQVRVI